jgi:hypothetical protein
MLGRLRNAGQPGSRQSPQNSHEACKVSCPRPQHADLVNNQHLFLLPVHSALAIHSETCRIGRRKPIEGIL